VGTLPGLGLNRVEAADARTEAFSAAFRRRRLGSGGNLTLQSDDSYALRRDGEPPWKLTSDRTEIAKFEVLGPGRSLASEHGAARILGVAAESLLDAEQLVVLRHAIGA
jgi:hypothetical protein